MPSGAAQPSSVRRPIASLFLLLAVAFAPACGGEDTAPAVVLDGSPRHADDEGVITALDVDGLSLTLDDKRSYEVSEQLRSFSALDLSIQPLADAKDAYVQVGLDGRTVVWLGRIAKVVPTQPPRVFYVGRFTRIEDADGLRRAVFGEGTVLALGDGVEPPPDSVGAVLQVEIDPATHRVIALRPA
ncbi:MAG TPA: hypothetical protein VMY88_01420 [Acidimicrobiales bacterium]|nr:hypothetical protein [Acidimicrobiales bacterium]